MPSHQRCGVDKGPPCRHSCNLQAERRGKKKGGRVKWVGEGKSLGVKKFKFEHEWL